MPRDLDDLLAEGAPRDPGRPDLAAIESRAARRRTGRAGATVIALVAAIGIAFQSMPSQPDRPIIGEVDESVLDPTAQRTFPLPAVGEVSAVHVDDLPALIVHGEDGVVRALHGISPHVTKGLQKALAWCIPGGFIEDIWHNSRFGPNGAWIGGPASTGLKPYEIVQQTATSVTLGELGRAPTRESLRPPADFEVIGECGETGLGGPDLALLTYHAPQNPNVFYITQERIDRYPASLDEFRESVAEGVDNEDASGLPDLDPLGEAGFAMATADGVDLLSTSGAVLAAVPGELVVGDPRDGHGGAILLRTPDGVERWVAPSNGTAAPADQLVVAGPQMFVEQPDGTWSSDSATAPRLDGPLHVGNGGRHVTGPACDLDECSAPTRVDFDMGGVATTRPGCVATDGFADFNLLEVCAERADGDVVTFVRGLYVDGEARYDAPRYDGQPDDAPWATRIRDAVFGTGDARVVAQLSLECEVPSVVAFDGDGAPFDPFGGARWEDGPDAFLLGTISMDGGAVPLVQVLTQGACGKPPTVEPGVWALTPDGPTQLNDIATGRRLALWTDQAPDLESVAARLSAVWQARNRVCDEPAIDDVSGDGVPDPVHHGTGTDSLFVCVDGEVAATSAGGPLEASAQADLDGDGDVELLLGQTTAWGILLGAVDWRDGTLRPIALGDGGELGVTRGISSGPDGWEGQFDWGCRDEDGGRQVVLVDIRRRVDVAEVSISVLEVRDGIATVVDERTEDREPGGEDMAAQVLRELGSEPAFTQREQRGCLSTG